MTTTDSSRTLRLGRRTKLVAAVAAVAAFLATVGTAPAVAAWTSSATATGSASSPSISVTQSGLETLNATLLPSTGAHRDTVTMTNTGDVVGDGTLLGESTSQASAGVAVYVWRTVSAATCAAENKPSGFYQGTWANFPSVTSVPLSPGASATYCIVSQVANADLVASVSGEQSVSATVTARLSSGLWSAVSPASATLRLQYFYPRADLGLVENKNNWFVIRPVSNSGECLDVAGAATSVGTRLQSVPCSSVSNQRFELTPTQNGNLSLTPRNAPGLRAGQSSHATVLQPPTDPSVHWRITGVTASTQQIVHSVTGRCLTMTNNSQGQFTVCNGANTQRFTITREPLTCSTSGSYLYLDFKSGSTNRTYTLQNSLDGGAWADVYTQNSLTVSNYSMPRSMFGANGTLDLRVVDAIGNVIYSGMTATTTDTTIACGAGFA